LVLVALTTTGYAQTLSFDFEGVADISELTGWTFIDDIAVTVDGNPTQYLDTIVIETSIVHGGSQALRLGVRDIAAYPLNGQFGTLDLWVYDYGYVVRGVIGAPTTAYGSTWGLRKYVDVDTSVYYPDNEPMDHGVVSFPYGLGAGHVEKSYLSSTDSYGTEWGGTPDQNLATIGSPDWDWDPEDPILNAGWGFNQSWYSCNYLGYLPNGRPAAGGWNHWQIAYTAPGVADVTLLETWAGDSYVDDGTPENAFDGTAPGGVDEMAFFGGMAMVAGAEPELWFGDLIVDDITWTPAGPTLQADFDGDGDVDLDDFVILKNHFGTGTTHAEGDADLDGDVDLDDFVILKNEFGSSS